MPNRRRSTEIFLIVGILFIAVNLRPALSSVGPLIDFIRADLGLSGAMLGLLTTLPLLAFGVVSMLTPIFTKRFGFAKTLLGAMALLTIGIALRSMFDAVGLYLGTIILGVAIAFGNVLIPALTKQNFPRKAGLVTSMYSSAMGIGAALAAGISVPLVERLGLGWRGSLSVWAMLSFTAFWIWLPQVRKIKKPQPRHGFRESMRKLSGAKLVWQIAIFMGLQSLTFYVILAWLPALLIDAGYDSIFSGWMLSLSQATGILGSVVIPLWAGRRRDQRLIVGVMVVLEFVGLIGLMFPQSPLVPVWISLLGFVLGGTFGFALLLIVLRSSGSDTAAELSGIVQSIGYLIAATGPFVAGVIYDFTLEWNFVIFLLMALAMLKLWAGMGAGRPTVV